MERVTLIVDDGEKVCSNAAGHLSDKHELVQTQSGQVAKIYKNPFLLHQRCATHAWSLLFKDLVFKNLSRLRWLKEAWELANEINHLCRTRTVLKKAREEQVADTAKEGKKYAS